MLLVFGSINLDLFVKVARLPHPGETVLSLGGASAELSPGGKGANQAHAARLMGASVCFIGATGNDIFASRAMENLRKADINLDHMQYLRDQTTGLATIMLDSAGENSIVVASGANACLKADTVPQSVIDQASILLLQGEVPLQESVMLAKAVRRQGGKIICNVAPFLPGIVNDLNLFDTLILNSEEHRQFQKALRGQELPDDDQYDVDQIDVTDIESLARHCGCAIVLTQGPNDVIYHDGAGTGIRLPGLSVTVIDTTGAGDTFAGIFAAACVQGEAIRPALDLACRGAATACTRVGAQSAQPGRNAILPR